MLLHCARQYFVVLQICEKVKEDTDKNDLWKNYKAYKTKIPPYYNLLSNSALLVEAGMGCAVCLDGALSIHADPELCFRPLSPTHITRSVILWKKNHLFSQAVSLFVQTIQEH